MPLLHSRPTSDTYNGLVDRVTSRLAAWKSKLLSIAGRATLVHVVTSSIPIYTMQTVKLPVSVCEHLDRLNRNFFWGGREEKNKVHLCQWDLVCRPKCKGGMGFKKSAAMNQALLSKIGWRVQNKDNGLWAKIFEAKYLKGASILDSPNSTKKTSSHTWKGIVHGVELLLKGMRWRIGSGDQAKFWKDSWCSDIPLLHQDGVLKVCDANCVVSSFFLHNWWDISKLREALSEDLVQQIVSIPVGFQGSFFDTQIWSASSNGVFSVKTAYNLFFAGPSWPESSWAFLWKLKVPPKLQIFFWLASHNKILSNEYRVRRQLAIDSSCEFCDWPVESVLHIFRDCERARSVWHALSISGLVHSFFKQDFIPWLKVNLLSKAKWGGDLPWSAVFVFTCWYLWKWRNNHIFLPCDEFTTDPVKAISMAVREWIKASLVGVKVSSKFQILLSWKPPGLGMHKLNVDGSRRAASGCIGAGGVIRGADGDWICGFAVNLGKGQILEAELWGLYFGLQLAWDKGITNLLIEMDAAVVVSLVQQADTLSCHPLAALIQSCCALMRRIGNCHLDHVYREMNVVADCMANWSSNLDLGVCFLDEAPAWVSSFLEDDFLGVVRPRLVCNS
ncbi:hypothetical protein CerSpe_281350 [Prunus speciosa]